MNKQKKFKSLFRYFFSQTLFPDIERQSQGKFQQLTNKKILKGDIIKFINRVAVKSTDQNRISSN